MGDQETLTVSIGKLAEIVQGEILSDAEMADESVENLMVGAMCVDPSPQYFGIRSNKAVITRGDRADIQLGALETSTKCLILTGGLKPIANVMQVAHEKRVPVIAVEKDTPAVLADIEAGMGQISAPIHESEAPAPESEDAAPEN